jgi:hypothetical protein
LPDYHTYGDLAGFGIGGRDAQSDYVAEAAAAANFIGALEAMVEMAPAAAAASTAAAAAASGEEKGTAAFSKEEVETDAARWNVTLAELRQTFAQRYVIVRIRQSRVCLLCLCTAASNLGNKAAAAAAAAAAAGTFQCSLLGSRSCAQLAICCLLTKKEL